MREHKFIRAPKAVSVAASGIVKQHHKPLFDAKVTFDLVFCRAETDSNGQPKTFALQRSGHRCLGIAGIIPLLDRAMGRADAQIKIDADWWDKASVEQQLALLDHEIMHFQVKKDELDAPMEDDLGRPRLEMRQHDWEISGFRAIAERYGSASVEVMEARELQESAGQILFKFDLEPA